MRVHSVLSTLAVCLIATSALAQEVGKEEVVLPTEGAVGFITDGVNRWEVNTYSTTTGATTDFEVPIGTDHQFATWWWYRVAGDSQETLLPPPDLDDFSGDTATLTWNDVDGRGLFSASLVVRIIVAGSGSILLQDLEITNLTGGDLDIQVFHYADMDMDGTLANDSATEITPTQMEITEASVAQYFGLSANYQVDVFPVVRDNLLDSDIDNFTGTGLPFGPADFTGAYQTGSVIGAGSAFTFTADMCVNACDDRIFEDGFESGDTTAWSNTVP